MKELYYTYDPIQISRILETELVCYMSPHVPHLILATPVEIIWNNFARICNTCLDLVPTKLCSPNSKQPWITTHIKRLSRRKKVLSIKLAKISCNAGPKR